MMTDLHTKFNERLLPTVERHAGIYFRQKDQERKADLVAEAVGLAWKWFVRLEEVGKDATEFPSVLASYAAKAVNCGRGVCGQEKAKDVMSGRAQQKHGFTVGKLPDISTESTNPLAEALADNTVSPVDEQVQFRCDFPDWLTTRTEQDRRLIDDMLLGHRTTDLASKYGKSEGRISQQRREFLEDWSRFIADDCQS